MYSETVIDHFANPRNVGIIQDADGYGRLSDESCGDVMEMFIKVCEGRIADVRYRTFGCAIAVASSSMASEMTVGRSLDEAAAITASSLNAAFGGLPESKFHCAVLAAGALHLALEDYWRRHPEARPAETTPMS
jgi:nitrogen fixation NifU-like protein